ncbi:hypothetical protein U1Q18_028398 [Sarracenia purpurea var. burkii]
MLGLPEVIDERRSKLTARGGSDLDGRWASIVGADPNAADRDGWGISALAGVFVFRSPRRLHQSELWCRLGAPKGGTRAVVVPQPDNGVVGAVAATGVGC